MSNPQEKVLEVLKQESRRCRHSEEECRQMKLYSAMQVWRHRGWGIDFAIESLAVEFEMEIPKI
jgi:hypothetical protein